MPIPPAKDAWTGCHSSLTIVWIAVDVVVIDRLADASKEEGKHGDTSHHDIPLNLLLPNSENDAANEGMV